MFNNIRVKDFALVEKASLNLGPGLNIISGQTGAGKSILIGALSMVLGERVGREIVRRGKDFCEVEASFVPEILIGEVVDFLKKQELGSEELILRRKFYAAGRSVCYINDCRVTLTSLKSLGDMLVDIHSQNQHQALLNRKVQRQLLDKYSDAGQLAEKIAEIWEEYSRLMAVKETKEEEHHRITEEADRLRFELKEIEAAGLYKGIEEDIDQEYNILNNAESLFSEAAAAYNELYEVENSILERVSLHDRHMEELKDIDSDLQSISETLKNIVYEIETVSDELRSYKDAVAYSPSKFNQLSEKKDQLNSLKRKYGGEIESVMDYSRKIKKKLADFDSYKENLEDVNRKIAKAKLELETVSKNLSKKRQSGGKKLSKKVAEKLDNLGMQESEFKIELTPGEIGPTGREEVLFKIKTNPGEALMELKKVASGGETSRVMLAVKSALADADSIPILIFDEIDTGIGATIGSRVAEEIKKLSKYHQIIVVTHMPQIASKADTHFKISKGKKGDRTVTEIKKIDSAERLEEIARLLGGKDNETAKKQAGELIKS